MGDTVAADDPCVSCRTSSYTIQQLARLGLPVEHLADGTGFTLDELRQPAAFIPWGAYLTFLENSHRGVPVGQYVTLCTSYNTSPYLRPLLTAAGLWFDPARYFEWVAAPNGALQQLFRCLDTRAEPTGQRELVVEERLRPGFAPPPDLFWECQALGLSALTTHFGLGPSIVTWERIEGGAAFRVRLPRRRPVRQLLATVAAWLRRGTPDDLRAALFYGHERSLRLEREVAARKRAEAAHRASEERLRRITDTVPGIVYQYVLDPDGRQGLTFISGGAAGLLGYTADELLADPGLIWALVPEEFAPGLRSSVAASARDGAPWHREFQFRTRSGAVKWVRGHSVPEPPDASGRVVWNGLLTDITEQKRAETALRRRDELLRKLSEQVPGVIYQYRQWPDGRSCFPYAGEGIRAVYEVAPDEVRESAAAAFARLHPDDLDRVAASIARSVETLAEWRCEYRVRLPVRGERWLEGHAAPERLPDGSTLWHGHINDVTDRKLADEALRASETRFRHMSENIPGAIIQYTWRPGGTDRVEYMSPACDDVWEVPAEAVRADPGVHRRMVHPEDVSGLRAAIADGAARLGPVSHSWRITTPSGRLKWLQMYARPEPLAAGSIRWNCAIFDVTAQKRADQALRASEERFRLASEAFQGLLYDLNVVTGAVYRSAGVADLIGYSLEEVPSDKEGWVQLLHPDDRDRVLAGVAAALAAGDRLDLEYRLRHRDGHYVDVWDRGQIVRGPDGAPVRIVGSTLDQTTRKRAEAALRVRNDLYLMLARTNQAVGRCGSAGELYRELCEIAVTTGRFRFAWVGVPDGDRLAVAARAGADGGYLDEIVISLDPADPRSRGPAGRVLTTGQSVVTNDFQAAAGTGPWHAAARRAGVAASAGLPLRQGGRVVAVYSLYADARDFFTPELVATLGEIVPSASFALDGFAREAERRAAETALRESEERFRAFMRISPVLSWIVSADGIVRYANENFAAFLGRSPDAMAGRPVGELFGPEYAAEYLAVNRRVIDGGVPVETVERAVLPNGSEGRFLVYKFPIPRADGTIDVGGVAIDITDRVRAEDALRESEEKLRTILDSEPECVKLLDRQGRLLEMNPAGLRMVEAGTLDEVRGAVVGCLVADADRAAFDELVAAVFRGESRRLTFAMHGLGGTARVLETHSVPLWSADGREVRALLGVTRDVTERVRAEERLRDSVREKEAMLKEIHHRVKNNLQVISSLLNLQAERIADPDARAVFRESQSRVRAMALVHETLYGSESLARIELPRYLERLCDSLLQTYGRAERVGIVRAVEPVALDLDRAVPVGLIAGELVSNALKYAFPGGRAGQIRVSVAAREGMNYSLTVSDDGVGLPPDLDLDRATTLGLYLVRVLTQQLRGTLEVGPAGGGATFTVRFPA